MPQSVDSNSFYHKRFSIPAISLLLSSNPRIRRFVSKDPNPGYALICDFAHVKITLDLIFGFNKTEFVSIAVVSVGKNLPIISQHADNDPGAGGNEDGLHEFRSFEE